MERLHLNTEITAMPDSDKLSQRAAAFLRWRGPAIRHHMEVGEEGGGSRGRRRRRRREVALSFLGILQSFGHNWLIFPGFRVFGGDSFWKL